MTERDPFYTLQPKVFVPVVRGALARLKDIQLAFVYGSSVRGDIRADSDIDIMMISDEEPPLADLGEALLDMECALGRRVDLRFYTPEEFLQRLEKGTGFIPRVMLEPKLWIIGSEHQLNAMVNHSRILQQAGKVLGSHENAVAWLMEKSWALGGARPVDLTATDGRVRRVERVLGWIEQGTGNRPASAGSSPRQRNPGHPSGVIERSRQQLPSIV